MENVDINKDGRHFAPYDAETGLLDMSSEESPKASSASNKRMPDFSKLKEVMKNFPYPFCAVSL